MSKIICDVCGTSYPDTATQCPICGCVRPADIAGLSVEGSEAEASGGYTYVKGGRFSKTNVKKRAKARQDNLKNEQPVKEVKDNPAKANAGFLIGTIIILLLIIAVVVFITIKFFWPSDNGATEPVESKPVASTLATENTSSAATTDTVVLEIPCEGIYIDRYEIDLTSDKYMLSVTREPADTTDKLIYSSSDPSIVTVDDKGVISAVSAGRAVITVQCGEQVLECVVYCHKDAQTTEPTTEPTEAVTTEPTTEPIDEELRLNRSDITFSFVGETWDVYSGHIPDDQIMWTTDDEKVVSVKNGILVAEGNGITNIHAEYGDQKVSCIIRCNLGEEGSGIGGSEGGITEDGEGDITAGTRNCQMYSIYGPANDITFADSIELFLRDENNVAVEALWSSANEGICTVSSSGYSATVTVVASGTTNIRATYNGVTYTCIVHVSVSAPESDESTE